MTDTEVERKQHDAEGVEPSLIARLAKAFETELSPGDMADLRRLDPDDPAAPGFWKVVVGHLEPGAVLEYFGPARDEAERRWAVILSCMAITQRQYRPGRRLGEALGASGLSELRFVRLLRAHGPALANALRLVARFLASKAEPLDWADLVRLVLSDDRPWAEPVRRQLARDYYRAVSK